jgi:DNA polymerase-3 subunit delta'
MIDGSPPHAVLFAGPSGVGKTTLAVDLAAGLLCSADAPADRPCGTCRGCRMVASGNHPDLHRLAPDGPGGQVRIGERTNAAPGTVRALVAELALLPVEGGARVAIVEHADRMNDDAQSALLKTLEEPPPGVTLVLCADEEERLLPTVRSRCTRVRLGPVPVRDIETLLADSSGVEPSVAARLARISGGRPGVAFAYAARDALAMRAQIARTLLDLLAAGRRRRLAVVPDLLKQSAELAAALDPDVNARGRAKAAVPAPVADASQAGPDQAESATAPAFPAELAARAPAAERRRAATLLLEIWRDLARDLAVVSLGDLALVRDPTLLDDLVATGATLPLGAASRFLPRLAATAELVAGNVSPELALDVLALSWPRPAAA